MEARKKKKYTFVQALNIIRNEKVKVRKEKKIDRNLELAKKNAKKEEALDTNHKANKKRQYRTEGKREQFKDGKKRSKQD